MMDTSVPINKIVLSVLGELESAIEKFPTWPNDPLHALAVLGEEFGELTKGMLQMVYEPHKTNLDEVKKEAIQTAAMAIRLILNFEQYNYSKSNQHYLLDSNFMPRINFKAENTQGVTGNHRPLKRAK